MQLSYDTLQQRLRGVLGQFPAIQAAYLFGSRATGNARADSDLDLGLVGPARELGSLKLDILAILAEAGIEHVDLVVLESADPVLRFEAVHPNCLVHARAGFEHGAYFSRTLREYFDLEPYLEIQRSALKRRLLHGEA